jgi:hypothetical protein
MLELSDKKAYNWFDSKYSNGEKPTLEDRAHLLALLKRRRTPQQIENLCHDIDQALHYLGRKGNCSEALTIIAYHMISELATIEDVPRGKVEDYIDKYRGVLHRRCPHLGKNFE